MRISQLTVSNYRVFAEKTLTFSDSFTVIAGVNGRGKTSILDGLALLFSRLLPYVSPMPNGGYRFFTPSDIHLGATQINFTANVKCVTIPIDFKLSYSKEKNKIIPNKIPKQTKDAAKSAYGDPNRPDDSSPLVVYYTTDRAGYRLPKKDPKADPRGRAAAYNGALINRTTSFHDLLTRYRVWVKHEQEQRTQDPSFREPMLNNMSDAIGKFLGAFSNLRVVDEPRLTFLIDKESESGVETLDLMQLSDGERSLLAIVTDLTRRLSIANPELQDPKRGAGVVLIDELELHLHPKWQREVVDKLRETFPNIQFIVTTHSPFIVQSVKPGELVSLDVSESESQNWEYSDNSIENIAEDVMGVPIPQKSRRYTEMMKVAKEYFRKLHEAASQEELDSLEMLLKEKSLPFSDDPAFHASLQVELEFQKAKRNTL